MPHRRTGRAHPGGRRRPPHIRHVRSCLLTAVAALCALPGAAVAVVPAASVTCTPASWSAQPVTCTVSGSEGAHRALVWTETQPTGDTAVYTAALNGPGQTPVLLGTVTATPHVDADQAGRIYVGAGNAVTRYDETGAGMVLVSDACGAGVGAGGTVTNIAFTGDGSQAAITCHEASADLDHVLFWNGRTVRELRQASAIVGVGQSVDISPDGTTIATIGTNVAGCARTCIYETSTITGYATVAASPDTPPAALAFVNDGADIVFSDTNPADLPYELATGGPPDSETPLGAGAGEHVLAGLDGSAALVADSAGNAAALAGDGSIVRALPTPAGTPALASAVLAEDGDTTTRYRVETSPGSGEFGDWTDIANGAAFTYTADGASRIDVQAQNGSGSSPTVETTAAYDATAPSLQAGGLSFGHVVGEVGLFATVSDTGSGVARVVFEYRAAGSTDWQTACLARNNFGAGYSCDWSVDPLPNGAYEWRAEASDAVGNTAISQTGTATVAQTPIPEANPTVTGTATEGETLSATDGDWASTEPLTYTIQWQRSTDGGATWTDIPAATGLAYTLAAGDVGAVIRVRVTASGQEVSAIADARPTAIIAPRTPPPPPLPTVHITAAPPAIVSATAVLITYTEAGAVESTACALDTTPVVCDSSHAALTHLSSGQHTFTVLVSGPGGPGSDTARFAVTPPPSPPSPPAVSITRAPALSTTGEETITYAETGAVNRTTCTLNGTPVGCSTTAAHLVKLPEGSFRFAVAVSGPGGSTTAQAAFTVRAARNLPPVARASARRIGPQRTTQSFRLDARASHDPDGRIVAWRWLDARGRVLGRAAAVTVRLRAGTTAHFQLIVTDNAHRSSTLTLTLTARRT